jgi:hypothetical protein
VGPVGHLDLAPERDHVSVDPTRGGDGHVAPERDRVAEHVPRDLHVVAERDDLVHLLALEHHHGLAERDLVAVLGLMGSLVL